LLAVAAGVDAVGLALAADQRLLVKPDELKTKAACRGDRGTPLPL
jgi:hypothetical protein